MSSKESQDFGWLDEILIKLAGKDGDPAYSKEAREAKATIQAHFTAQAKQHQAELLRARIAFANKLGFDKRLDNPILYCVGDIAIGITEYIAELQAELDKLEGEK